MLKYKNNYKLNSVIGLHKPRTLPLTFKVFAVCVEYPIPLYQRYRLTRTASAN